MGAQWLFLRVLQSAGGRKAVCRQHIPLCNPAVSCAHASAVVAYRRSSIAAAGCDMLLVGMLSLSCHIWGTQGKVIATVAACAMQHLVFVACCEGCMLRVAD